MRRTGPELTPQLAEVIGFEALKAGSLEHIGLRASGATEVSQLNQWGERSILGDVTPEQAIIRRLDRTGIPLLVKSEEHGTVALYGRGQRPVGTVIIDGRDGSSADKKFVLGSRDRLHTRSNIMIAIAAGDNPTFDDVLFAGIQEDVYPGETRPIVPIEDINSERSGRLIYATKGEGTWVQSPFERRRLHVVQNDDLTLGPDTPGYYLEYKYFGGDGSRLERFARERGIPMAKLLSTGSHYVDLVTSSALPEYAINQPITEQVAEPDHAIRVGEYDPDAVRGTIVFVAETTRKGLEELIAGRLIVVEAGGVVRTLVQGVPTDVRDQRILIWNQKWREDPRPQPVVAGVTAKVTDELLLAA